MDKEINQEPQSKWMTTARIETLVDGIFAISMTLLVLSLDVPILPSPVTEIVIQNYLWGLVPKFYIYALSFILLAVFWRINHEQFHKIERVDTALVWINVLWLMFVALVPFSTSLMGDYGYTQTATIFFHMNMLLIGLMSFINWYYAYHRGFMNVKLSEKEYWDLFRINIAFPVVALIAIGATYISPSWSSLSYLLITVVKKLNDRL